MKKIAVIGHFGFGRNDLDGQTVKTKIITKELETQFGEDAVIKVDTHGGKKVLVRLLLQSFWCLKRAKNVVMMPAQNGIKFFSPILLLFNKIFKRKLFYIVIGGWLPEYLKGKKQLEKRLKNFDGIFVETKAMKMSLGFRNVFLMPNCKELKILSKEELIYPSGEPYKFCTFSRVCKEKGIEDAVNAIKSVNEQMGRVVCTLDIYGQIDKDQTEWFEKLRSNLPEYIAYGGLVEYDKSVGVLKEYFALLFPTYYAGEGFAGTILDSFSSGLPIIASDWRYNAEIIEDGKQGYIFKARSITELEAVIRDGILHPQVLLNMKEDCLQAAKSFLPSTVIKIFLAQLR